jgi:acetylornithine deacetylase/succinyl-diaminopimelate desuccinylase-like protein
VSTPSSHAVGDLIGELEASVDAELDAVLALLADLVAQESVEGSACIARCLDLLDGALAPLGGRARRLRFDTVENLLIEWGDPAARHRLLLTGHADVVPADGAWATPPFSLVRRENMLVGRGVCDMKGALAAYVGALRVLDRLGALATAPVSLVVTGDEEVGSSRGMVPLLEQRLATGTWAVCGEPTGLDVFTGNRGVMWFRIRILGRGGHAGLAHTVVNPLPVAARVVAALDELPMRARDDRFDPPTASLTVTAIMNEGEATVNSVPDSVALNVDRRLLPGETAEEAIDEIVTVVSGIVRPPFRWETIVDRVCPPYVADVDEPLVAVAQAAVRATGRRGALGTDSAADDSSWLGKEGIATVLCGPGAPEQAHVTGETLSVAELRDAVAIYARLCLSSLSVEADNHEPRGAAKE